MTTIVLLLTLLTGTAASAQRMRSMRPPESTLEKALKTGTATEVKNALAYAYGDDKDGCVHGDSLASLAARRGAVDILKVLIEAGYKVDGTQCRGDSPLYEAAELGHIEAVRFLLGHKPDLRFKVGNGSTALLAAVHGPILGEEPAGSKTKTARLLLDAGSEVEVENEFGHTPLLLAVRLTDAPLVRLLVKHKADPAKMNKDGLNPLALARKERLDFIVSILEGKDRYKPTSGGAKLTEAVKAGDLARVQGLLAAGVDANGLDEGGNSPLILASFMGREDIASTLLAAGADPKVRNAANDTALHYAAPKATAALVKALLQKGADPRARDYHENTPLAYAVREGKAEAVGPLLAAGAAHGEKDADGVTLLMEAAKKGDEATVLALLEGGASADAADKDGRTALLIAADEGKLGVTQALLERGADPRHADTSGATPLQKALSGGHADIARLLQEKGVKPDAAALMSAVRSQDPAAVRLLLKNGARPGAGTGSEPILVEAAGAYNNKAELTELLLSAGAPVNAADHKGTTPLMAAARYSGDDSVKAVRALLKAGADTKAKDEKGLTAWQQAMLNGHNKGARLLAAAGSPTDYNSLGWDGSFLDASEATAVIVTDPKDWEALWKRLGKESEAPEIDFKRYAAAFVFVGRLSGPDTVGIDFEKPIETKGTMTIGYTLHPNIIYDVPGTSPYAVRVFARGGATRFAIASPPVVPREFPFRR
ncbi:MAG: hypothetical protein A2506_00835 [Elusimicrobia bacterium RIFOXYD12_FULL_66_9]|nr:MAG: hypothetical protein A2506_00835 [Elusimicrobia bacterium RIFOXYD12_FULL_66_9]